MLKRFCDWCEDEVTDTDSSYFYVTLEPSEQSSYRSSLQTKHHSEICNWCMSLTVEFIRTRKKEK